MTFLNKSGESKFNQKRLINSMLKKMARIIEDLWTTRLQYRDEIEDLVQNRYVP